MLQRIVHQFAKRHSIQPTSLVRYQSAATSNKASSRFSKISKKDLSAAVVGTSVALGLGISAVTKSGESKIKSFDGVPREVLEKEWESFNVRAMNPEEDDDDDDDDDDDGDDDDDEGEVGDDGDDEEENEGGESEDKEEESNDDEEEEDSSKEKEDEEENQEDSSTSTDTSAENDSSDEDEPTTCTICLINRQGPCRSFWRKFEGCMKEYGGVNRKKDDEGSMQSENNKEDGDISGTDNDSTDTSNESLGEKCDMHMIPWLTCVQSYRNAYTLITNKFYQTEFIDEVEKGVKDNDKIKFVYAAENVGDRLDPNSFLDLSDWFNRRQSTGSTDDKGSSDDEDVDTNKSAHNGDSAGDDVDLVPASATINVIDPGTGWEIDIAYVRDQDGSVLGFEQFTTLKRERREAIQYMEQKK